MVVIGTIGEILEIYEICGMYVTSGIRGEMIVAMITVTTEGETTVGWSSGMNGEGNEPLNLRNRRGS